MMNFLYIKFSTKPIILLYLSFVLAFFSMRVKRNAISPQNCFVHTIGHLNFLSNGYGYVCMYVSLLVIAYTNVLIHEFVII